MDDTSAITAKIRSAIAGQYENAILRESQLVTETTALLRAFPGKWTPIMPYISIVHQLQLFSDVPLRVGVNAWATRAASGGIRFTGSWQRGVGPWIAAVDSSFVPPPHGIFPDGQVSIQRRHKHGLLRAKFGTESSQSLRVEQRLGFGGLRGGLTVSSKPSVRVDVARAGNGTHVEILSDDTIVGARLNFLNWSAGPSWSQSSGIGMETAYQYTFGNFHLSWGFRIHSQQLVYTIRVTRFGGAWTLPFEVWNRFVPLDVAAKAFLVWLLPAAANAIWVSSFSDGHMYSDDNDDDHE